MSRKDYPATPDGRYFVAKGKLWRRTDPRLDDRTRRRLVKELMQARRGVGHEPGSAEARAAVHAAKVALGERGPVWWDDGAPDETLKAPGSSSYAGWWESLDAEARARGTGDTAARGAREEPAR